MDFSAADAATAFGAFATSTNDAPTPITMTAMSAATIPPQNLLSASHDRELPATVSPRDLALPSRPDSSVHPLQEPEPPRLSNDFGNASHLPFGYEFPSSEEEEEEAPNLWHDPPAEQIDSSSSSRQAIFSPEIRKRWDSLVHNLAYADFTSETAIAAEPLYGSEKRTFDNADLYSSDQAQPEQLPLGLSNLSTVDESTSTWPAPNFGHTSHLSDQFPLSRYPDAAANEPHPRRYTHESIFPSMQPTEADIAAATVLQHTSASRPSLSVATNGLGALAETAHASHRLLPQARYQTMQEFRQERWGERQLSAVAPQFHEQQTYHQRQLSQLATGPKWGSDQRFSATKPLSATRPHGQHEFESASEDTGNDETVTSVESHSRCSSQAVPEDAYLQDSRPRKRQRNASDVDVADASPTTPALLSAETRDRSAATTNSSASRSTSIKSESPTKKKKKAAAKPELKPKPKSKPKANKPTSAASSLSKPSIATTTTTTTGTPTSGCRRASVASANAPSTTTADTSGGKRLYLTNEQRRANHNNSEKRRRKIAERGYAGLKHLVPNLAFSACSKSVQLNTAADYIEALVEETRALRAQLES